MNDIRERLKERSRNNNNSNNRFGVCEICQYSPYRDILRVQKHKGRLMLICPQCVRNIKEQQNE